jgi:hypothetical protein
MISQNKVGLVVWLAVTRHTKHETEFPLRNTKIEATATMTSKQQEKAPKPEPADRTASEDSAAFYEGDEYDVYDDFELSNNVGGKQQTKQKDSGGTIYSSKHVRAKENLQRKGK